MNAVLQYLLYLILLVALAAPLGGYISRVMSGEKVLLSPVLVPCENAIYKLLGIDKNEDMGWKKYARCVLAFSILSLVALSAILMLQGFLPLNPQRLPGLSWHLAFNTAVSFVTNTNWQAYSGESALSYFSQSVGFTVQNFVSAAVGIAVLFVLIRGFFRTRQKGIGSFWTDVTRAVLYIMLPLSLVLSLALVSQGVVQNLKPYETVDLAEPIVLEDGTQITRQIVPMGPQASQVAPKQLGTNGGGYNGTNSASPLENPTPFSNLLEMLSILLIPAALCFSFGRSIGEPKQGYALFAAMFLVLAVAALKFGPSELFAVSFLGLSVLTCLDDGNVVQTIISNLIATTLETQGYQYRTAKTGAAGVLEAVSCQSHVILLDLGLPDMDGVDIIRKVRGWSNVPIIVVSARSEDKDKVDALDAGADDYLTKPFSVEELLARLRVALRRVRFDSQKVGEEASVYQNGALKIDYAAGCVFRDGQEIHLTPIEYKLLCLLAKNTGKVLTHNYILKEIWGNVLPTDTPSLRVFMATLRKKIEPLPSEPQYIQTHIGIGYRMLRIQD